MGYPTDEPMMQLELPTRSPLPLSVNDMDQKPSSSSSFSSFPSLTFEDTRSFLRRALPTVDGGGGSSSRRMRVAIEPSLSSLSTRLSGSKSLGRDVGHAAAETYLVTRLAITLLRYLRFPFLRVGCRWITKFVALICYATFLMPGFLQVGYFFFFSSPVRRSIIYGDKPRNLLDLYFPTKTDGLRPVVAFVTGGAWIIGYKAWGALLGKRLAERGIIVACKDYRNFPQGTICSMVEDVSQGISFMCNNAEAYGVDPNRIDLIGQSAGAHIASCTILNQEIKERREGESTSWSVSQIKAYFGISGGVGYRWITKFLALVCYATLLTPGFLQVGYFYYFSSQVRRSIIYGDKPRNRLDLYLPAKTDGLRPVVAFVTGGAWIIGYKAWGALLGRRLAERGIIVACIDYRNFPQGTISSMVEDVSQGISFMCNNAEAYGGDPNRIYLIGQSAGAHIASCTILNQAITECGEGESTAWSVSQIKAYFGISGGYNVVELVDHFHGRGLYQSIFLSVMEGEKSLRKFSPEILVKDSSVKHAISLMPPTILFHGTGDYSIPSTSSEKFANALHNAGAKVKLVLYDGKTHTDLFLQDPLRGGRDKLLQEIISVIYAGDEVKFLDDAETPLSRRLVPEFMLKLAGRISPF